MTDDLERRLRDMAAGAPPTVEYSEAITALARAALEYRLMVIYGERDIADLEQVDAELMKSLGGA